MRGGGGVTRSLYLYSAALYTGKYIHNIGVFNNRFEKSNLAHV